MSDANAPTPRSPVAAFTLLGVMIVYGSLLFSLNRPSSAAVDLGGVLFLALAGLYHGPLAMWWGLFVPICGVAFFGPIARWEILGLAPATGDLLRYSLIPFLSLSGGSILVVLFGTRHTAFLSRQELELIRERNQKAVNDLRTLRVDLESAAVPEVRMQNVPLTAAQHQGITGPSLPFNEMQAIVRGAVNDLSQQMSQSKGLRISMSAPIDTSLPMSVAGSPEDISSMFWSLLRHALASLAGGQGHISVTLRPGLAKVYLSVEDNGRGLNEQLLKRLEAKGISPATDGRLSVSEVRDRIEKLGGTLDVQARLGVGARLTLEIPRVDSFSHGSSIRPATSSRHA